MTDLIAAMIVEDVPPDHAKPGMMRSKCRPAKTNRVSPGRASGITDPRAQRAWRLARLLRALDDGLPLNTAITRAVILLRRMESAKAALPPFAATRAAVFPHGLVPDRTDWRRLVTVFPSLENYQREAADYCRGSRKEEHEALLKQMRRMALDPAVRKGFELERDRLIEEGLSLPDCP